MVGDCWILLRYIPEAHRKEMDQKIADLTAGVHTAVNATGLTNRQLVEQAEALMREIQAYVLSD